MTLPHSQLVRLLQQAYSAEKAAAFAYIGHAGSVRDPAEKLAIQRIERDEWQHREQVAAIMQHYGIPPSRYFELKYHVLGKIIAWSCYVIGWFMPYYFAGRLESGNVCEYFIMLRYFRSIGITDHDETLYEMGMKEKEHEVYFQNSLANKRLLPLFERIFGWGRKRTLNDVDLDDKRSLGESATYCRHRK
ncbi:MAG: ferritin-like domain-containing protein [Pirellulales bacterium]